MLAAPVLGGRSDWFTSCNRSVPVVEGINVEGGGWGANQAGCMILSFLSMLELHSSRQVEDIPIRF